MPDTQQRKLIRAAGVAILMGTAPAYPTAAGASVQASRIAPWKQKDLPAISLHTGNEKIVPDSYDTVPKRTERHVMLVVDFYFKAVLTAGLDTHELDDALDDAALDIERAFEKAETEATALNGTAAYCRLDETDVIESEVADGPCGCLRMTFDTMYYGAALEPSAGVVDAVSTYWSLANAQTDTRDQAHDDQEFST